MYAVFSHPYRGAVKGGSEIVEGELPPLLSVRENFTTLDSDATLSGLLLIKASRKACRFVWLLSGGVRSSEGCNLRRVQASKGVSFNRVVGNLHHIID